MANYQSIYLSPRNEAFDASEAKIFESVVQGTSIDKYQIRIYDNSDDSLDYDSGEVSLGANLLFGGEKLSVTIPANTLVNGKEYKWHVVTFEGARAVTSSFVLIRTNAKPVITFAPPVLLDTQSYNFSASYSQAQSIPVSYSQFLFYDHTGKLILTTDKNYTGRISYMYEGFISGKTYQVKIIGYTSNNMYFETLKYTFDVAYAKPNLIIAPSIAQDPYTSIVDLSWGGAIQINGTVEGASNFVADQIGTNNISLELPNVDSVLGYSLNFPEVYSVVFVWHPKNFTSGKIAVLHGIFDCELGHTGQEFYVKYGDQNFYSVPFALTSLNEDSLVPALNLFPDSIIFPSGGIGVNPFLICMDNSGVKIKTATEMCKINIAI